MKKEELETLNKILDNHELRIQRLEKLFGSEKDGQSASVDSSMTETGKPVFVDRPSEKPKRKGRKKRQLKILEENKGRLITKEEYLRLFEYSPTTWYNDTWLFQNDLVVFKGDKILIVGEKPTEVKTGK